MFTYDGELTQGGWMRGQAPAGAVSARLGEWMQIGGSVQEESSDRDGALRYSTRRGGSGRTVQLKVEELP